METEITGQPTNLEEAVETLLAYYADDVPLIRKRTEEEFVALAHFGGGMFTHNSWCLFWNEKNRHPTWPQKSPRWCNGSTTGE